MNIRQITLNTRKIETILSKNGELTIFRNSDWCPETFSLATHLNAGQHCLPLNIPSLSGADRANDERFALERSPSRAFFLLAPCFVILRRGPIQSLFLSVNVRCFVVVDLV